MAAFARGELHVLVATTVVDVGIDVPNATVMVVEHAERFGLSQLHQLRGRVGRGSQQSSCILLYQFPITDDGRARLKMMTESTDGFLIAEKDLELRGPGDVFGTRQAGAPTLRVGDLRRDHLLMERARQEASAWLDAGASDPGWLDEFRRTWGRPPAACRRRRPAPAARDPFPRSGTRPCFRSSSSAARAHRR